VPGIGCPNLLPGAYVTEGMLALVYWTPLAGKDGLGKYGTSPALTFPSYEGWFELGVTWTNPD
jgi:hypothetical protein